MICLLFILIKPRDWELGR